MMDKFEKWLKRERTTGAYSRLELEAFTFVLEVYQFQQYEFKKKKVKRDE